MNLGQVFVGQSSVSTSFSNLFCVKAIHDFVLANDAEAVKALNKSDLHWLARLNLMQFAQRPIYQVPDRLIPSLCPFILSLDSH